MSTSFGVALLCCALWLQSDETPTSALLPDAPRQVLEKNASQLDGLELNIALTRRILTEASKLPVELNFLGDRGYLEYFLAPEANIVRIDGRRFFERSIQGPNGSQIGERTYDGRVLYSGRPPGSGGEALLTIDNVDRRLADSQQSGFPTKHFHWNYFEDAGYYLPDFPHELGESSSSLVLHLARRGRVITWLEDPTTGMQDVALESPDPWSQSRMTPEQIKEAVSHLLGESRKFQEAVLQRLVERSRSEPNRRYRFSLDPTIGFAVREKWEETTKGELLSHTVCEQFVKVQNRDLWLPNACRVLIHATEQYPFYVSPTPLYEISYTLNSAENREFTDKDFELWYDVPGGSVFDYTSEKATVSNPVQYRVPADASELERAAKVALSRTRWLIFLNVAILGVIAICFILRRRRVPGG